jgi:hypothetical protein
MAPNYFRFLRKDITIPERLWALLVRNTGSAFVPEDRPAYQSWGFYASGGFYSDDVVALKVYRKQETGKNLSSFEIWENSSDTWSRTYDVTGSDVTTSIGNGAWFVGTPHAGVGDIRQNHYEITDYSTNYDASTKTMYVCARTSTAANTPIGQRTTTGEYTQPWTTLFKTQKSGGSWSSLTELGELSASSVWTVQNLQARGLTTEFMTNDGTIAGRSQPPTYYNTATNKVSRINFFNPNANDGIAVVKTDSVLWSNYVADGNNMETHYWGQQIGTNHNSTKVYSGGIISGSTMGFVDSVHHVRYVYDIIASSSLNGWDREAQITGSQNHAETVSGQYGSMSRDENSFAFNDDYAVMGMPSYKANRTNEPSTGWHMGAIHIYKKTGATWADHELIHTLNGSSSLDAAGLNPNDTHTPYSLFGNAVAINSDNDIAVTAPNYKVDGTILEGGAVLILTKSANAEEWGHKLSHLGIVDAKIHSYNDTPDHTTFRIQHFSNNYMFVTAPSGSSNSYQGVDLFNKSEA